MAVSAGSALGRDGDHGYKRGLSVQLGPRPFYLVDGMTPSPLKASIPGFCKELRLRGTDAIIGA